MRKSKLVLAGLLSFSLLTEAVLPVFGASVPAIPILEESRAASQSAPDRADEADNGLYYIDSGTTYRSGATLQFYATGAGYGPEEPQELNPVEGSTRYIPTDWRVSTTSSHVAGNSGYSKGAWSTYTEETAGRRTGGKYVPGEYRYKGSFLLRTTGTTSVPFTLQVNYRRQTYKKGVWKNDWTTASVSVEFYIRNVSGADVKRPENLIGSYRTRKQIVYRITGAKKAVVMTPRNKKIKSADIPDTITVDSFKFKVTAISESAFSGCTHLKNVRIGKNVRTIGKNAFYGSKKLAAISFKTTKLTKAKVGSNAFKGIKRTCRFEFPAGKTSLYKKIIKSKGFRK